MENKKPKYTTIVVILYMCCSPWLKRTKKIGDQPDFLVDSICDYDVWSMMI